MRVPGNLGPKSSPHRSVLDKRILQRDRTPIADYETLDKSSTRKTRVNSDISVWGTIQMGPIFGVRVCTVNSIG